MSDKTRSKQSMQKTKLIQSGTSSPNKRIIQTKWRKTKWRDAENEEENSNETFKILKTIANIIV